MTRSLLFMLIAFGTAHAAPPSHPSPARPRAHLVTHELMERLSPEARKNEQAVIEFPHATGIVVASDPVRPKRILILTNYHVAGSGPPIGNIKFRDGTIARPIQTVVSNSKLDYAMVEADLVSGPRRKGVEAVRLDPRALEPSEPVYAFSAHSDLKDKTGAAWLAGGNKAFNIVLREQIAHAKDAYAPGFRTIQMAEVAEDPKLIRQRFEDFDANGNAYIRAETLGVSSELPNAPGMSGSGVFSANTHGVVALHFSGNPSEKKWDELSVPIELIARDVNHQLERDEVHRSARDLVMIAVSPKNGTAQ